VCSTATRLLLSQSFSFCARAMDVATSILPAFQAMPYATPAAVGGLVFAVFFINKFISNQKKGNPNLLPLPGTRFSLPETRNQNGVSHF